MKNTENTKEKNQDRQQPPQEAPKPSGDRGYERADMDRYGRGEERRGDKDNKRYAESYSDEKNENDRGENRWNDAADKSAVTGETIKKEDYPHYGYENSGMKEDVESRQ